MEDELSNTDLNALRMFLLDRIENAFVSPVRRRDVRGEASGNLFGQLQLLNRALYRKVKSRERLVQIAKDLGFVIHAGKGGAGLAGSVVWEYIDVPDNNGD